jgi:hypothetical protein
MGYFMKHRVVRSICEMRKMDEDSTERVLRRRRMVKMWRESQF